MNTGDADQARETPWLKRNKEQRQAIYRERENTRRATLKRRTAPRATPTRTIPAPAQASPAAANQAATTRSDGGSNTQHGTTAPDQHAVQRSINRANKTMLYDEAWFLQPWIIGLTVIVFVIVLVVLLVAM